LVVFLKTIIYRRFGGFPKTAAMMGGVLPHAHNWWTSSRRTCGTIARLASTRSKVIKTGWPFDERKCELDRFAPEAIWVRVLHVKAPWSKAKGLYIEKRAVVAAIFPPPL
jgi:hypothetical protein